jgi:hypothetical protein
MYCARAIVENKNKDGKSLQAGHSLNLDHLKHGGSTAHT